MDQENFVKTPTKYFEMEKVPAGLTNYKKSYLFTPCKEPTHMQPEGQTFPQAFEGADMDGKRF